MEIFLYGNEKHVVNFCDNLSSYASFSDLNINISSRNNSGRTSLSNCLSSHSFQDNVSIIDIRHVFITERNKVKNTSNIKKNICLLFLGEGLTKEHILECEIMIKKKQLQFNNLVTFYSRGVFSKVIHPYYYSFDDVLFDNFIIPKTTLEFIKEKCSSEESIKSSYEDFESFNDFQSSFDDIKKMFDAFSIFFHNAKKIAKESLESKEYLESNESPESKESLESKESKDNQVKDSQDSNKLDLLSRGSYMFGSLHITKESNDSYCLCQ